jgi:hypothetical protein
MTESSNKKGSDSKLISEDPMKVGSLNKKEEIATSGTDMKKKKKEKDKNVFNLILMQFVVLDFRNVLLGIYLIHTLDFHAQKRTKIITPFYYHLS